MAEQITSPPVSQGGWTFNDFLGYGVIRAIDSEFGNPTAPNPYGGPTYGENQYLTDPTGQRVSRTGQIGGELGDNKTLLMFGAGLVLLVVVAVVASR